MTDEVEALRNSLSEIVDPRTPKTKSAFRVRLVWSGATAIEPGSMVKLGNAAFDPTDNPQAPFEGLTFHCSPYTGAEELVNYAITMGPISGGTEVTGYGVGYGIIPGAYWAKVSVTNTAHTHAAMLTSGVRLGSTTGTGLRIIWKPSGIGQLWCVVSLSDSIAPGDFPVFQVRNLSGLPRSFGEVFGLGTCLTLPPSSPNRFPLFDSTLPVVDSPYVVLLADVAVNGFVDCAIIGSVSVRLNFTDATHKFAQVVANDYTKMASAGTGPARIIRREKEAILGPGTLGLQWAQVELGKSVPILEAPRAVIYSVVSKATGNRDGPITPGQGIVRRYVPPTGPIGTAWNHQGATLMVETWMHSQSDVGKPVLLRESRKDNNGQPIYEMISEGCASVPIGSSS